MGLMPVSRPPRKVGMGGKVRGFSLKWVAALCIASFFVGVVVNRFWSLSESDADMSETSGEQFGSRDIHPAVKCEKQSATSEKGNKVYQVSTTHDIIMMLNKTISSLEMRLAAARGAKAEREEKTTKTKLGNESLNNRPKVFLVVGIVTALNSRKRRDSIRETWMPQGKGLKNLEKKKGIIIRFVIGHSATPGGVLDRDIEAEEAHHNDILRLNHVEGHHQLSSKIQIYFSTAADKWDAEFYVKVDDDVHVNLGILNTLLSRHQSKPRTYIGCMKSGPVLAQKGVKYHEPEYWKFGKEGNKYFRHAAGQIYAISKDLATYISVNRHILHSYTNEDVSVGSWFIGLDVEHIDDRSLCCGTPPDCELKAQAGNPCAASFDSSCSGICKSAERMDEVHRHCGESDGAIRHLHS